MSLLSNNQSFQDNMRGNFKDIGDNAPCGKVCTKYSGKMLRNCFTIYKVSSLNFAGLVLTIVLWISGCFLTVLDINPSTDY